MRDNIKLYINVHSVGIILVYFTIFVSIFNYSSYIFGFLLHNRLAQDFLECDNVRINLIFNTQTPI